MSTPKLKTTLFKYTDEGTFHAFSSNGNGGVYLDKKETIGDIPYPRGVDVDGYQSDPLHISCKEEMDDLISILKYAKKSLPTMKRRDFLLEQYRIAYQARRAASKQ